MQLKILDLNCQHDYRPELEGFLKRTLASGRYDFILLQEADEKVLRHLDNSSYELLTAFNEEVNEPNQLCVIYRTAFKLKEKRFHSFSKMHRTYWAGAFGFLFGLFEIDGRDILVGSTHLHALFSPGTRFKEVKALKRILKEHHGVPMVFGGDFNTIFPGETSRSERALVPEFVRVSNGIKKTLDSRYVEFSRALLSFSLHLLGRLKIGFSVAADHIYMSTAFAESCAIVCTKLPDRVSDHSPIELVCVSR